MTLETVLGLMEHEEELRPIIEKAASVLESYGPLLKKLLSEVIMASVDMRAEAVARLEAKGFSREEAIYMTMDQWWGMRQSLSGQKKHK
jgi:hypothetical protein